MRETRSRHFGFVGWILMGFNHETSGYKPMNYDVIFGLIGGLEHFLFFSYIENNHPNWLINMFQRGWNQWMNLIMTSQCDGIVEWWWISGAAWLKSMGFTSHQWSWHKLVIFSTKPHFFGWITWLNLASFHIDTTNPPVRDPGVSGTVEAMSSHLGRTQPPTEQSSTTQ